MMKTAPVSTVSLTPEEWEKLKEDCRNAGGALYLGADQEGQFVRLVNTKSHEGGANHAHWKDGENWRHQLRVRENGDVWVFEHVSKEENLDGLTQSD